MAGRKETLLICEQDQSALLFQWRQWYH